MSDGTELPGPVLIERLCSSNNVSFEGYTDLKGGFSLQLGQHVNIVSDASGGAMNAPSRNSDPYSDCELHGVLAGYRSSTIQLAGPKTGTDGSNIGTIALSAVQRSEGLFISGTSGLASKDARKAFEKGTSYLTKKKLEQAEKEFRKAVTLQPKYTDAWFGLGKTYAAQSRRAEAREALLNAIATDSNYVYPYEQLYRLAFAEGNWQELASSTDRLLRLDPYEFPDAYYFNGVAHFELKNWDVAQKSLIKAIEADERNTNPKTHYVLGLVLVGKKDLPGAANKLEDFARIAPNDPQVPKARAILSQIAKVLRPGGAQ